MRTILALGILVALTASASAGTANHKRHAAPATQTFAPKSRRVRLGALPMFPTRPHTRHRSNTAIPTKASTGAADLKGAGPRALAQSIRL